MREDMHEVLVERPRTGMRGGSRARRLAWERKSRSRDGEAALPSLMPMKWKTSKYLNENLKPLARYLRGQVGRPWDAVYSDIRARLDADSVVKRHVLQHLEEFVLFARREGDRIVLDSKGSRGRHGPNVTELLPNGFIRGQRNWTLDGTLYVGLAGIVMFAPRKKHVAHPSR